MSILTRLLPPIITEKIIKSAIRLNSKSFGSYNPLIHQPNLWTLLGSGTTNVQIPQGAYSQQLAQYISYVYRCSRLRQQAVSSINHRLLYWNVREQAELELTDHPWLDFVDAVNEDQTFADLIEETILRLDLNGRCYWYPVINERLKVLEKIYLIAAPDMFPEERNGVIEYYRCEDERVGRMKLYPDQVIPFFEVDPSSRKGGYSKVSAVGYTLKLMAEARQQEYMTVKNLKRPDFGLLPEASNLTTEQIKDLRQQFLETMSGEGIGLPIVLAGIKDIKTWQFSSRDLQFLKGLREVKEEICGIFGVPLVFILPDDANRANLEGYEYIFQRYTVDPLVRYIEDKINQRIMPLYGEWIYIEYEDHIPSNRQQDLLEQESHIRSGYSLIDEERALAGLEPLPNGLGSVIWRPMSDTAWHKVGPGTEPITPVEPPKTPPEPSSPSSEASTPTPDERPPEEEEKSTSPKRIHFKIDSTKRLLKTLIGSTAKNSPYVFSNEQVEGIIGSADTKLSAIWKRLYRDITDETIRLLGETEIPLIPAKTLTTSQSAAINKILRQLEKQGYEKIAAEEGQPVIEGVYKKAGQVGSSQVQIGLSFDVYRPEALAEVANITESFAKIPTDTSLAEIQQVIETGIEEGQSILNIQRAMEDLSKEWEDRSELIARTETQRAVNMGHREAFRQTGIIKDLIWICSNDDVSCEFCLGLDGTVVGIQESFVPLGATVTAEDEEGNVIEYVNKYDSVDTPPLHPNCRCTIAAGI